MKKMGFILAGVAIIILASSFSINAVAAQQSSEEAIVVKKSDLPPELFKSLEAKQQLGKYSDYVAMGKGVGVAVREGLEAVTHTAAKFANTTPGKFTMFIIAYKIIGIDFVQFLVGVPLLIIGICVFIWSYRKNCIPRQIPIQMNEKGEPTKFEVVGNDDKQKWGHVSVFFCFVGLKMIDIFA